MDKEAVATYVQISREDFEGWLKSLPYKWERVSGKAGVYLVKLSDKVAVQVSSSIGSRDDAMGRGKGAIHMKLVSLINGRTLNKKAQGQSRFNRTKNWKTNLKKGVESFKSAYMKAKSFYDKLADNDPAKHKDRWTKEIESIPNWESDKLLHSFHEQLGKGHMLSDKQESIIERAKRKAPAGGGAPDPNLLEKLREVYRRARARNDDWTLKFIESVGKQIKGGRALSPKQQKVVEDKLQQYRVAAMRTKVASLYLYRNGRGAL